MQEKKTRGKRASKPAVVPSQSRLQLRAVQPQTDNQETVFREFGMGQNLMLSGMAGTGKTYLSLYLALREVEAKRYDRIVIVRSIVPTRDPGFLPGNLKDKTKIYETPYHTTCSDLYDETEAYEFLKRKGVVEFLTTSFVRGTTLNDCVIVVDEIQNMKWAEIASVVTRVGKNCRIICIGDFRQTDLIRNDEKRGILDFIKVAEKMKSFSHVEFGYDDILRSDLVKEFLIAKDQLDIQD